VIDRTVKYYYNKKNWTVANEKGFIVYRGFTRNSVHQCFLVTKEIDEETGFIICYSKC